MKRRAIKYAAREGRVKTTLWLDREILRAVANEAEERRVSKQAIMESTLKDRYSEAAQFDRDAVIADRLNKLERGQRQIADQNETGAEALALFIRMWLASTPDVPLEERDAAVQSARERYDRYLVQLAKRLGQRVSKPSRANTEVSFKSEDF
jgi:hypothetical protein